MKKLMKASAIVALSAIAAAGGCAASRHGWDAKTGVMTHGEAKYAVDPPVGQWKQVSPRGSDLAFFDKSTGGIISADTLCEKDYDAPLQALEMHLFIGFTDIKKISEKTIPFDGREALRAEYSAKLDGVQRGYLVFILKKDWCVYDLVYHAPAEKFDQGKEAFEAFVLSFRTVK